MLTRRLLASVSLACLLLCSGVGTISAQTAAEAPAPSARVAPTTPASAPPPAAQPDPAEAPTPGTDEEVEPTLEEPEAQPSEAADAPAADADSTEAAAAQTALSAGQEPVEAAPAPVAAEANGTCETPRQAWLQLLYWLQKNEGRWEPERAAACFDRSELDSAALAAERAEMLKEVLDARSAWIDVDALPTNPNYTDNETGLHRYTNPAVRDRIGPELYLVRQPSSRRWVFSAASLAAVPDLYPKTIKRIQDSLPGWSKALLFGIELWKYGMIVLLFFVAWLVKSAVVTILGRYMRRITRHPRLRYLDRLVEHAQGPIGALTMALVFSIALPYLLLPGQAARVADFALELLITFAAVWLAYRLIDVVSDFLAARAATTDSKLDDQLVPLVTKVLKLLVVVIGGIFILQNRGVNVGSLLAGLGIGGLAVALAAKDTLANFFGSLMIFIDKPFQVGDWVVVDSTEGVIEEVGFRTSRVRTFYNSLVTVPNALVTNSMVDNYGARRFRRYKTTLGLAYDTPPAKIEAFCEGVRALIARTPGMRTDFYMVEFTGFGASALELLVYSFMDTPTWNEELRTRSNLNLDIMRLAHDLGVSFAFPTQTLHVSSLPQMGASVPSHSGPSEHDELAAVVKGYARGGDRGLPSGSTVAGNFDCDAATSKSDEDG
ncbi:mechanosensitive ion channel family protein [Haliangium ochraceum]|uniref:MscS Mechanosensitive ion channel n=1 Tax=Haliangium ochraceum (strain DSM 14365 / JCM 11303 / SMP-2) TaxID=502025 RepID=D0LPV6_HALO1|nr:mechanosensitive ion channel family protein [Haliangium ochraceum]ACY16993.1 MscS Mechanosensitive ion channel [Haliangium ochraceum DSM 14365]